MTEEEREEQMKDELRAALALIEENIEVGEPMQEGDLTHDVLREIYGWQGHETVKRKMRPLVEEGLFEVVNVRSEISGRLVRAYRRVKQEADKNIP